MNNAFINTLKDGFAAYKIDITDEMLNKLFEFNQMVMEVNKVMNLTAVTDDVESAKKHFLDSINPPIMDLIKSDDKVIDIGSGAGFPGIPLAIVRPDVHFTLLDTRQKRCDFLSDVVDKLALKNARVIWDRAEVIGKNEEYRETFDVATARAVAQVNVLSEYLLPFVKLGGYTAMYKLDSADGELENGKNAISILGGEIVGAQSYTIIGENRKQAIVSVKKISHTPTKYPRKSGLPTKRPL